MRTRQKQRIIIGTLCAVIIGLVVGYAVLSSICWNDKSRYCFEWV